MSSLFSGQTTKKSIKISRVPDGTRIIVTSDQQIPFQDDRLLDTIYGKFAKDFAPTLAGICPKHPQYKGARQPAVACPECWTAWENKPEYHNFFNGDFMDLYSLSRFPANVTRKFTLADEVAMGKERLAKWRKHFTHNHYVFGNHEMRWDNTAFANNPETAEFNMTLDKALGLDELGYDWVPYRRHYEFMGFIITHGDTTVKYAAAAMYNQYHKPGTSGHVNRPQSYTFANAASGNPDTWYCTGMTCLENIGDYIKIWSRIQPWQQAFLIGEVRDGTLFVELVRVHHGKFWAAGKMYTVGE